MTSFTKRGRLALAGVLAVAAIGSAAPPQADTGATTQPDKCEVRLDRLEDRFRTLEERRGWDAAAEWWNEHGWPRYYERCVAP
jgi:hypothetical protein